MTSSRPFSTHKLCSRHTTLPRSRTPHCLCPQKQHDELWKTKILQPQTTRKQRENFWLQFYHVMQRNAMLSIPRTNVCTNSDAVSVTLTTPEMAALCDLEYQPQTAVAGETQSSVSHNNRVITPTHKKKIIIYVTYDKRFNRSCQMLWIQNDTNATFLSFSLEKKKLSSSYRLIYAAKIWIPVCRSMTKCQVKPIFIFFAFVYVCSKLTNFSHG